MRSKLHLRGLALWPYLCFLALFAILLLMVIHWYLLPAMSDISGADEKGRKILAAHALLLMSVVLVILMIALLLSYRVGRHYFTRQRRFAATKYTDAWAESAKRMKLNDDEDKSGV